MNIHCLKGTATVILKRKLFILNQNQLNKISKYFLGICKKRLFFKVSVDLGCIFIF